MSGKKGSNSVAGGFTGLLFILVIVVALILIIRGCGDKAKNASDTSPVIESSDPNQSPEESGQPEESPSPEPSESPEPTPSPTSTPTPTPTQQIKASGSFKSDTGVGLNVIAEWSAVSAGNGKVTVTVDMYLNSYSIGVNASPAAAQFNIGGKAVSANVAAINIDSQNTLVKTLLASASVTLELGSDGTLNVPITAEWLFGGTYSGKEFESIGAAGTAAIS